MEEPELRPVVAYRSWRIGGDGNVLLSNNGTPWSVHRPLRAFCSVSGFPGRHQDIYAAPAPNCTCGIYCYNYSARRGAFGFSTLYDLSLSGLILCWGRIQVHRLGYRVERARPIALVDMRPVLSRLEATIRFQRGRGRVRRRVEEWTDVAPANPRLLRIATKYGIPILPNEPEAISAFAERWA